MKKTAFYGTGLMGEPMAHRLLQAGYDLMVFNRTASKTNALEKKGAKVAQSACEAVDFSDVSIIMLADYKAICDVFAHIPGKLENKTFIQMSTISAAESLLLEEYFEKKGGSYLEAPVLGSIPQVKASALIILAGGKESIFKKWDHLLEHFGEKRFYIGEAGKAAAVKLAFNQLSASLLAAFSMSLGYLRQKEVDTDTFMDILRQSALYAPAYDRKLDNILKRDFSPTNFPLQLLLKDVNLMLEEFAKENINTLPLQGVCELIKMGLENSDGNLDYSALYNSIHPAKKFT